MPDNPLLNREGSLPKASVAVDKALLDRAKSLGIDIEGACAAGLTAAIRNARATDEPLDPEVAESWNAYVRNHGLPLGKYRTF
ncbi:type II toxin-antitoxin system CcdA family antitoxin [Aerophototrophica crusticola]|uniref:Type II toxin-antitoxin system CcdA family antitoxin n=1 Tax=Aerophototrophica crusticola TaxID=1709002 RepID=A0A858RA03_9PROT|nr:type II toxin-antitoxin system CcdA family antitoxin [Rhodospirillaceae bacterium B3]